ncbi:MAG: RNA-directed DNA polymerase [Ahniella sp.]|nr:RNA-directed DNA polymerase [Ahniella sp.]
MILCDISDFYSRIYHHRVENALKWLNVKPDVVKRIVEVLQVFSGTVSYGLPVGGPASRLLAEISLNSVDKLLRGEGIRFCRFVDDYRIFCDSKEEAYQRLIFLSEKLFNEGLSLQKDQDKNPNG